MYRQVTQAETGFELTPHMEEHVCNRVLASAINARFTAVLSTKLVTTSGV